MKIRARWDAPGNKMNETTKPHFTMLDIIRYKWHVKVGAPGICLSRSVNQGWKFIEAAIKKIHILFTGPNKYALLF